MADAGDEAIQACYRRLGRLSAREKADKLLELIRQYRGKLDAESPMSRFLQDSERQIQRKGKIGQHFADDPVLNEDLLKCLVFMERNEGEQLERLMSSALYGDSKYFERYIKQKALSILRTLKSGNRRMRLLTACRRMTRCFWKRVLSAGGNPGIYRQADGNPGRWA